MTSAAHHYLFVPGEDPAAPPLLLLHGTGGDERDLLPLAGAVSPGSAVLAPRGNVNERGAWRFFRRFTEGVFDLDDVRRRTDELADFLDGAVRHHGLTPGALTAIGFSNGANIAAALLLRRPEVLAGAVLLRAMVVLPEAAAAGSLAGRRVQMLNGDRDPIVPPDHPERLALQLRAGGADVTLRLLRAGHGLGPPDAAAIAAWLQARPDTAR